MNLLELSLVEILKDKAPKSDGLSSLLKSIGPSILPIGVGDSLTRFRFNIDENNVPTLGIHIGRKTLINALTLTPNKIQMNIPLIGKSTFFSDDVTISSRLFVNELIDTNNLNIRQSMKIQGNITGLSNLNISGTARIYTKIQTQEINTINDNSNLLSEQSLTIVGK